MFKANPEKKLDYFAVRKKEEGIWPLSYLSNQKANLSFHQRILDINERSKQVIGYDEYIEVTLDLR